MDMPPVKWLLVPYILVTLSIEALSLYSQFPPGDELRKPPELDEALLNKVFEKVVGDTVHLPCPVYPMKGLFFEWLNGGQVIDELFSSSRFRVEEETGYLRIKKLKTIDSGVYVCRAINGFGSASGYVELQVMTLEAKRIKDGINENKLPNKYTEGTGSKKNSKLRNSYKPIAIVPRTEQEIYAHIGQDVSLMFTAKGQPGPKSWWYFKSYLLPNKLLLSSQYKEETTYTDVETMVTTLTLFNVTTKLAGKYSVRAVNEKGMTEATFILGVYPVFKSQIIGDYPTNKTVVQGDTLKLSCKMRVHSPEPRIQWIRRSQPLNLASPKGVYSGSTCSKSHLTSPSNLHSMSPSGILLSSSAVSSASSSPTTVTTSPVHVQSSNQLSSMLSSNTIPLPPKKVLTTKSLVKGTASASSSTSAITGNCNNRHRRHHPQAIAPESRKSLPVAEIISRKSTLGYLGNHIYESVLQIDDFNVSDIGYYICFSLSTNEYRQTEVQMIPKPSSGQLMRPAESLSTRDQTPFSFSTVNQFNHSNFIAVHAIFWLIGSVIFLCCMASILFLLSVKKSIQASNNLQHHTSTSLNGGRSRRSRLPANATLFIEAKNIHTLNELPIHLEPVAAVKSNVHHHQSSIGRQRVGLTEVVIENHMVPKKSYKKEDKNVNVAVNHIR